HAAADDPGRVELLARARVVCTQAAEARQRGEVTAPVRGREPGRKSEAATTRGDVERLEGPALSCGPDLEEAAGRGCTRRPAGGGGASAAVAGLRARDDGGECQGEDGERGPEHRSSSRWVRPKYVLVRTTGPEM